MLSALVARPRKPPHLASPASLLYPESSADLPLVVWKRDACCFVDQLGTPQTIDQYLVCPGFHLCDLPRCHFASDGREPPLTETVLSRSCHDPGVVSLGDFVYPCCTSWPMGFSLSSYLAQSTLLAQCQHVSLTEARMLADDLLPPSEGTVRFALVTDDVLIFDRARTVTPTSRSPCGRRPGQAA